jgi:ABC-2 type transport system ATP-binding protein
MGSHAIETRNLVKGYGAGHPAVRGLDLHVPEGAVYGFLGRNGAGKTTTIKVLMGLLGRDTGEVSVLGRDPGHESTRLLADVGYVSERQQLYDYMTVREMAAFSGSFYPTHDSDYAESLMSKFELSPRARVRELSRGMLAKLCLLLALAHRPRLLILDEPTSGLDAVVRREFLESIIDLITQEGRTVFFSTHIIEEVERVADRVGIVRDGKMIAEAELEDLKASTRRVRLTFDDEPPEELDIKGLVRTRRDGNQLLLTIRDFQRSGLEDRVRSLPVRSHLVETLSLEEIFVDLVQ